MQHGGAASGRPGLPLLLPLLLLLASTTRRRCTPLDAGIVRVAEVEEEQEAEEELPLR